MSFYMSPEFYVPPKFCVSCPSQRRPWFGFHIKDLRPLLPLDPPSSLSLPTSPVPRSVGGVVGVGSHKRISYKDKEGSL